MTTNRLAKATNEGEVRLVAPKDAEERVKFWIERGNQQLALDGRHHLEWKHANGHYFIEPRR